jgi:hypothetical protein
MRFNSYNLFYDRTKKCDCLIEVTTWAGLTVYTNVQQGKGKLKGVTQSQSTRNQPYQEIVV